MAMEIAMVVVPGRLLRPRRVESSPAPRGCLANHASTFQCRHCRGDITGVPAKAALG